jgi:hypothetical protein
MKLTVNEKLPTEQLLQKASEEVRKFEEHFKKVANSPLSTPEREIIKAYIFYKIRVEKSE